MSLEVQAEYSVGDGHSEFIPFDVHATHDEDVPSARVLAMCVWRLCRCNGTRHCNTSGAGGTMFAKSAWNPRPPLDRQSARALAAVYMYVSFSLMSRCMRILAIARSRGMKTSVILDDIDSE
jgi:hypothetical protein